MSAKLKFTEVGPDGALKIPREVHPRDIKSIRRYRADDVFLLVLKNGFHLFVRNGGGK